MTNVPWYVAALGVAGLIASALMGIKWWYGSIIAIGETDEMKPPKPWFTNPRVIDWLVKGFAFILIVGVIAFLLADSGDTGPVMGP